jgi:hypothetical protein
MEDNKKKEVMNLNRPQNLLLIYVRLHDLVSN